MNPLRWICCILCLAACMAPASAQTKTVKTSPDTGAAAIDRVAPSTLGGGDTLGVGRGHAVRHDTVKIWWNEDSLIAARTTSTDTAFHPKKSATVAMLASMILPGAGQIYNGAYWKAPVVWGFAAYFYSVYRIQNNNYISYRDQYAASVRADSTHQGIGQLRQIRDGYKSDRNNFGWYLALTYLITVVDAYVDASLYNFEVSPDLQPHGEWKATLHIRLH